MIDSLKAMVGIRDPSDESQDSGEQEGVQMVKVDVTKEKSYTRHTTVITFVDGEKEEVEWDSKRIEDGVIKLYDYIGVVDAPDSILVGGFRKEIHTFYVLSNIKKMEKVKTEQEHIEWEDTETYTKEQAKRSGFEDYRIVR